MCPLMVRLVAVGGDIFKLWDFGILCSKPPMMSWLMEANVQAAFFHTPTITNTLYVLFAF